MISSRAVSAVSSWTAKRTAIFGALLVSFSFFLSVRPTKYPLELPGWLYIAAIGSSTIRAIPHLLTGRSGSKENIECVAIVVVGVGNILSICTLSSVWSRTQSAKSILMWVSVATSPILLCTWWYPFLDIQGLGCIVLACGHLAMFVAIVTNMISRIVYSSIARQRGFAVT